MFASMNQTGIGSKRSDRHPSQPLFQSRKRARAIHCRAALVAPRADAIMPVRKLSRVNAGSLSSRAYCPRIDADTL
jgi:hypothetical protein